MAAKLCLLSMLVSAVGELRARPDDEFLSRPPVLNEELAVLASL